MYRILIADDDPLVRREIKNSINRNEFDIETVAEARTSSEVLKQVSENPPDIILLDIGMSEMNGLKLAGVIKRSYPSVRIVIITDCDNFEYVQAAFRIGIDDYVLKPLTHEIAEELIKNQISEIENETAKPKAVTENPKTETAFLLNGFLRGRVSADAAKTAFTRFADSDGKDLYAAIMRPRISERIFADDNSNGVSAEFTASNIALEILIKDKTGFVFDTNRDEPALLIACPKDAPPDDVLSDIYFSVLDLLGISVEFGVSEKGSFEQMPQMIKQVRAALEFSYIAEDSAIFHYARNTAAKPYAGYPKEIEKALLNSLLEDSPSHSKELIGKFFEAVKNECSDIGVCKGMVFRLLISLSDRLEAMNFGTLPAEEQNELIFDPYTVSQSFRTLSEAKEWTERLFERAADKMRSRNLRAGKLFLQITGYIEQNYTDCDLNLKKCSGALFITPGYISRILKKNTGKTFTEYLNEYRIDRACEILKGKDSKIYETAQSVGFAHKTYFSSVFKKLKGETPRQYKESIQK